MTTMPVVRRVDHPGHPLDDMTAEELRRRIHSLAAEIAGFESRIEFDADDLTESWTIAAEACRSLRKEAIRLLDQVTKD